ncbi:MAG: hypothetical protein WCT85_04375 [Parachlamydiales bacterium]
MTIFGIPMWVYSCFGITIGCIVASIIIFLIIRKCVAVDILKKHHDLAGYIIGVFGVLYSVLLGFGLVSLEEHHGQIIALINEEAYVINDLYRSSMVFPEKTRLEMQRKMKIYVKSVIDEEWPHMFEKLENPVTHQKLKDVWQAFYDFKPKTEQESLWLSKCIDILNELNRARLNRIHWEGVGFFPWLVLLIGGIILTSFLFFFGTENPRAHLVLNSLFIGYFSFTLYVVHVLSNPFLPPVSIQPKDFNFIYPSFKIDI